MNINARVQAIALEQDAEMNTPPTREEAGDSGSDIAPESPGEEEDAQLSQPEHPTFVNFTQPKVQYTPQDHKAPQSGTGCSYSKLLAFIIDAEDRSRFVSQLKSVDGRLKTATARLNAVREQMNARNATWTKLNSNATPSQITMEFFEASVAGPTELAEFTARFIHPTANPETILKFTADFADLAELTEKLMGHGITAMKYAYEKNIIIQNVTSYAEAQEATLYNGLSALKKSVSSNAMFHTQ